MKKILLTIAVIFFMSNLVSADTYTEYDPDDAADYATTNYNMSYGSGSGENPFGDFDGDYGGNCTNFASQAIIAGMIGETTPASVFSERTDFDIDAGGGSYQWYYVSYSSRGPAFTGANKLYEYAVNNESSYKGLHFDYVTHDTPTEFMEYGDVEKGDIIFADWTGNGSIDHSMIVTATKWWLPGYNEIRVTYQGTIGSLGKTDIGLGDINEANNYDALFYVYRPVDYNPNGL